jgi:hypothetical protein
MIIELDKLNMLIENGWEDYDRKRTLKKNSIIQYGA